MVYGGLNIKLAFDAQHKTVIPPFLTYLLSGSGLKGHLPNLGVALKMSASNLSLIIRVLWSLLLVSQRFS